MKDNHAWSPDMDEAVNPHKYEPTAEEQVKAVYKKAIVRKEKGIWPLITAYFAQCFEVVRISYKLK